MSDTAREAPDEGTPCPKHGRVHDSHGWYSCADGGWWETKSPGGPVVWTPDQSKEDPDA